MAVGYATERRIAYMNDTPRYTRLRTRGGKVPLSTKLYQAIGALPDTYKNFAFGTLLLFYYNQVLGMAASLASLAIMIALLVDAVTDPVVGSFSDNLKSKYGRRHPLMYVAALPLGVTLFLTFVPPAGLSETGLFLWLTTIAILVRISMTFYVVPWNAMFAEFSEDYVERSNIVTFRYLVGWVGGVALTFATWTLIFPSTDAYTPGHLNPDAYKTFATVLGITVTLAAFLTTALTHREIPYLLQPMHNTPKLTLKRVLAEVKLALKNRNFLIVFMFILVSSAITGVDGALEIYMHTYFWGLLPEDIRWLVLGIFGAFLAFVLVNMLQQRYDKKTLLLVCVAFMILNNVTLVSLRFAGVLPENGAEWLLEILVLNTILRVAAGTVAAIVGVSMFADILDQQELNTGLRQEGVFGSAISFSGKATSGLGVLIGGLILDFVISFPEGATPTELDPGLVWNLGLVAGICMPLLHFVPLYLITHYDITRGGFEDIQRQLFSRRAEVATQDND